MVHRFVLLGAVSVAFVLTLGVAGCAAAAVPGAGEVFPTPWIDEGRGVASLPEEPPVAPRPPWWRDVGGNYRLVWRGEGEGDGARTWLRHELTASWRRAGLSAYGHWERPGGPGQAPSEGEGVAARFEWEPVGVSAPPGSPPAQLPMLGAALQGAAVRIGQRPLPSGDPFRLVYPEAGEAWRRAFSARIAGHVALETGRSAALSGGRFFPWQAAFQRAEGSPRGDEATWWYITGESPGGGGRWRLTGAEGARRGQDGYTAWAADGSVRWDWAEARAGYARRTTAEGGPYRAAGFARIQTRRRGPWTATVEWHRRDWGFRLPVGGDLDWKEGTTGWMWRLRRTGSPWEWVWEERVITPLPPDPLRTGSTPARHFERQPAYELTWRPARTWWLRLRHEGSSLGSRARYEARLRLTRPGITFLTRYDAVPQPLWLWRVERTWSAQRVRLDWDQRWRAWRAEYRREWHPFRFRIVYKTRDDPDGPRSGAGGSSDGPLRETFLFVEAAYRHPRGWGVTVTVGWDDRGRIDYYWRRPLRWELAWDTAF